MTKDQSIIVLPPTALWLTHNCATRNKWPKWLAHTQLTTYTYIINHYNPSVRIIDLVSHTTNVVCVNFIHKWRDLLFKVDSEQQIFWETFHDNFIYSQSFCQKSAERKSPKKYFSYFVFDVWPGLCSSFKQIKQIKKNVYFIREMLHVKIKTKPIGASDWNPIRTFSAERWMQKVEQWSLSHCLQTKINYKHPCF